MVYQVLARKWRPRIFEQVVAQEHILAAIQNSLVLNKVHHAYLLSGTRGVGKTTIARLFAKSLNCKIGMQKSTACGECKICLEIDTGCFLDVIEIDAASRTKVEETREFLDDIYYSPSISQFKIYLIDEVHMLSKSSLNALLKILEEPPKHVKFFLITTEQKKLPDTILSRCVQFYLRPLSLLQIFNQLIHIFKSENIEVEQSAVKLIAYFAKGSMRDALNLSEQAMIIGKNKIYHSVVREMLGIVDIEHSLFLLENLMNDNIKEVMLRIEQCSQLNINWDYFLSDMLSLLQKILIIQSKIDNYDQIFDDGTFEKSRLKKLAKMVAPIDIHLYYQIFISGKKELFYAPSYRMGFEMVMLRAIILLRFLKSNSSECISSHAFSDKINIANIIINQGAFVSMPVMSLTKEFVDGKMNSKE